MIISLIAAVSENNVIGRDNDLIWHLPADIQFFKEKTIGHCVLMGRKNYESIPLKYRPLKGRTNIVITGNRNFSEKGIEVANSIQEGIEKARSKGEVELFIIGGGEVYRQSMHLSDKLYITRVHQEFEGDTYFPGIDDAIWQELKREFRQKDERNQFDMTFLEFVKK